MPTTVDEQRSEDDGMSEQTTMRPPQQQKRQARTTETTDLERRVLAHERILQALIAHMAETQPAFSTACTRSSANRCA